MKKKKVAATKKSAVYRIAKDLKGLVLAHAFKLVTRDGYGLHVNKLDNVLLPAVVFKAGVEYVHVDVVAGLVKRSWVG